MPDPPSAFLSEGFFLTGSLQVLCFHSVALAEGIWKANILGSVLNRNKGGDFIMEILRPEGFGNKFHKSFLD
jgi:hypothetical protein